MLGAIGYSVFLVVFWRLCGHSCAETSTQGPKVMTDADSIEVGPGPMSVRLKKDQLFVLNCSLINVDNYSKTEISVVWTYDNGLDNVQHVLELNDEHIDFYPANRFSTYTFDHHPVSADAGIYTCIFLDYDGYQLANASIRLTCDPVPTVIRHWRALKEFDYHRRDYRHMPSVTIAPGDNITLRCDAVSNPPPTYYWFRLPPGVEADEQLGESLALPLENPRHHVQNDTLTIVNASWDDRGVYRCLVNNSRDYSLNLHFLVRIRSSRAYLWPLLGICVVVLLMGVIIGVSEVRRRWQKPDDEDNPDPNAGRRDRPTRDSTHYNARHDGSDRSNVTLRFASKK